MSNYKLLVLIQLLIVKNSSTKEQESDINIILSTIFDNIYTYSYCCNYRMCYIAQKRHGQRKF